jgi:hypothetical protein
MEDDKTTKLYKYLISIGFKDITSYIIQQLQQSKSKLYANVLERITASSYYYILERNNEVGIFSQWYVTKPEFQVLSKLVGKETNNIRVNNIRTILSAEEDSKYCAIANNRIEESASKSNKYKVVFQPIDKWHTESYYAVECRIDDLFGLPCYNTLFIGTKEECDKYIKDHTNSIKESYKQHINQDNFQWKDNIQADAKIYEEQVAKPYKEEHPEEFEDNDENSFSWVGPYYADKIRSFNDMVKKLKNDFVWACQETDKLDLIEKTQSWGLRDFVAEADYQSNQYDKDQDHRKFAMWKRVANDGVPFLLDDMKCTMEHISKYDLF